MASCMNGFCRNGGGGESAPACHLCCAKQASEQEGRGALDMQVGGGHYKDMKIQPIEFAMANSLNMCQANAVKYITRTKGDRAKQIEDRRKAIHCIELEIGFLEGEKE